MEVAASVTYLYFSNYCRARNLDNYADLFYSWSREELEHANKMLDYLGDLGRRASLSMSIGIDSSKVAPGPKVLEECLSRSLELERSVGSSVMRIHQMALEDGDTSLASFLNEFSLLVPKEINEKETHLERVRELGERLANDLLKVQ